MPVVALPPSNTPRYFVDYFANGAGHTLQLRYAGDESAPPPDSFFITLVAGWLSQLAPLMPSDFEVTGARYSPKGTDVTLPATAPSGVTTGGGSPASGERPAFLTFVGRSSQGRKVKVMLLGASASAASEGGAFSNYRVLTSENVDVADAYAVLQSIATVAIDGSPITWYEYVNVGYSAYWQKRVRQVS